MDKLKIKKHYRIVLWLVAAIGLSGINGVFLYAVIFIPEPIQELAGNIFAIIFMAEAFLLLPLLCILIFIAKLKSPNWLGFLVLSMLGSLAFSIPFSVLRWTREKDHIKEYEK